jgi:hypothetical protein
MAHGCRYCHQQRFVAKALITRYAHPAKAQQKVGEVSQTEELKWRIATIEAAVKIGRKAIAGIGAGKRHDGLHQKDKAG